MNSMIYNPLEEFETKFKDLHLENTKKYLENLVEQSGVNVEENGKTVKAYNDQNDRLAKIRKRLKWLKFFRVLMIITLILIPLVILKTTPKIKALKSELEEGGKKAAELLALAESQMAPLNALFTDRDAIKIIETTIPSLSFEDTLSTDQEANMIVNFDFGDLDNVEESTVDILAGNYNDNPFLFEEKYVHRMGLEIYHGYKMISWTETYRDRDGKIHTRTRSETLHATVTKPKPFYSTQIVLNYCAQGGPDLSFSRDATHLERKSEKEIDRYVKKGEKKLKKMTDKALDQNRDFVSMSNSDFEVLFDALDRTDEVQFRTLFTPLAQTNIVDLIRSQNGYGDDFNFIKQKRTNKILSQHSQGRAVTIYPSAYRSYSFETACNMFLEKNTSYFKAVYFDFAPLWSIPMYQERPVHSLKPIPEYTQKYSFKECEALANRLVKGLVVHPASKTPAIIKSSFVDSKNGVDEVSVTAYSYDTCPRVDFIPVLGGDGRWHNVPVPWDEYIPLEASNNFFVSTSALATNNSVIAKRNDLCIFN